MPIPFTRYRRPDARQSEEVMSRSPEVETKAWEIIGAGYRFEVEDLTSGRVSVAIHDPRTEEDVAIEVCENGPPVPIAVDKVVTDFAIPDGKPC
jgi:hypothetical protein